jgi:hypothetical protein
LIHLRTIHPDDLPKCAAVDEDLRGLSIDLDPVKITMKCRDSMIVVVQTTARHVGFRDFLA